MRIPYGKISCFCAAMMMAASVLYSCEPVPPVDRPEQEQETPGGGGDNTGGENPEPEVPVNADVIESAVLTFAYHDMIGDIDVENSRVDFYMETYGDDAPNLRYVPVVFTTKDGYKVKGTDREERLQWFRDVVKVFNELDIAYTTWENWGGDFGPGDWQSRPDEEVIDILMQRE